MCAESVPIVRLRAISYSRSMSLGKVLVLIILGAPLLILGGIYFGGILVAVTSGVETWIRKREYRASPEGREMAKYFRERRAAARAEADREWEHLRDEETRRYGG